MSTALQTGRRDGGSAGRVTVALGKLGREDWEEGQASSPSSRRSGLAEEENRMESQPGTGPGPAPDQEVT